MTHRYCKAAWATVFSAVLAMTLPACDNGKPRPAEPASTQTMMSWIAEIEEQGVRRPGYPADQWVEQWAADRFTDLGLEQVELEPIEVLRWEPKHWSLRVWHEGREDEAIEIAAWPVPLSAEAAELKAELQFASDETVNLDGKIAVTELSLLTAPQSTMRDKVATWAYDPAAEFDELTQVWPMSQRFQKVMDPEIEAGAAGFIGILDFPWQTDRYYVPYNARSLPIPGLYLSRANGKKLKTFMEEGKTLGRIEFKREQAKAVSHNLMGILPGKSDEWIIIGSHHDGPWHSAVEDASGVALVLAQARYWSQVPREQRPHNMMFLLNGGHMSDGAGLVHFAETRKQFLKKKVVAEIHLEHAAREAKSVDGRLVPTDKPEVRWWFTSFIPRLEEAVARAICTEKLERSLIMPPEGFPKGRKHPPTDAAMFHPLAPIVSFLAAPMYLFDPADRLNMVHEDSLLPLTQAVISIIRELEDVSAAELREDIYSPPRKRPLPSCAELENGNAIHADS